MRVPTRVSASVLVRHLAVIRDGVGTGDSLEGSFEYRAADEPGYYDVIAAYRVGNLDGQGGVVLLGQEQD